jgi:hypothetical protein
MAEREHHEHRGAIRLLVRRLAAELRLLVGRNGMSVANVANFQRRRRVELNLPKPATFLGFGRRRTGGNRDRFSPSSAPQQRIPP